MKTMKAVVKYDNAANATELRDVPIPEIGPNDVLVEVAYVGICGTDPHMHRNTVLFDFNCPFIADANLDIHNIRSCTQITFDFFFWHNSFLSIFMVVGNSPLLLLNLDTIY